MPRMRSLSKFAALAALILSATSGWAQMPDANMEFFEKKIRPVLVEHCYQCHSTAKKQKAGLVLDSRAGGSQGGRFRAGLGRRASRERVCSSRRFATPIPNCRCRPRASCRPGSIADLEKWVALGAPDPRTGDAGKPPTKEWDLTKARKFWCLPAAAASQPPPTVKTEGWARGPIDRFILAGLEKKGLKPAADADRADADSPGLFRLDRPAAHAGAGGRLRAGQVARCVCQGRRWAAGLAPFRRTLGPALAGRGPLCRVQRRRPVAAVQGCLALSRLCHPIVQRRQALQSLHHRADCRRPAAATRRPRNAPTSWSPRPTCCWAPSTTRSRTSRSSKWTSSTNSSTAWARASWA